MRLLVLGGTQWLGRAVAHDAAAREHDVTALARGVSGPPPAGVTFVAADRDDPQGYAAVAGTAWDAVVDVARQPGHVRGALTALADTVGHWVFVSSCSVYARHDTPGADEAAELLPAHEGDTAPVERYGEGKVACEESVRAARAEGTFLLARSGLVTGPGDHTDRTGYWPLRFAHPAAVDGAVLVPGSPEQATQVVDVRDLAAWLVSAAEQRHAGAVNVSGDVVSLRDHLATAREVAGHTGPVVEADPAWLAARGVQEWAGERSLPLWLHSAGWEGFMARDTTAARALGLVTRPLADSLADTLAWELATGPGRRRRAGLTPSEEADLLAELRGPGPD
ncbi:MAG TPA: NAD-dependent epimerase/dehydratase family protein [Pedococcus sp.]